MTKKDFINELAAKAKGVTKKDLEGIYASFLDLIVKSIKKEGRISFIGFGTFRKVRRKETTKINPKTKQKMKIPAKNVLRFKASKSISL